MISPIPEIRAGISVLCIMGFRIIAFRYCRSFVALSCQAPTTILCLEKVSHTGKRIKNCIALHHEGQHRHKKLSFAERSKSSFYLSSTLSVSANHYHRHSVGDKAVWSDFTDLEIRHGSVKTMVDGIIVRRLLNNLYTRSSYDSTWI